MLTDIFQKNSPLPQRHNNVMMPRINSSASLVASRVFDHGREQSLRHLPQLVFLAPAATDDFRQQFQPRLEGPVDPRRQSIKCFTFSSHFSKLSSLCTSSYCTPLPPPPPPSLPPFILQLSKGKQLLVLLLINSLPPSLPPSLPHTSKVNASSSSSPYSSSSCCARGAQASAAETWYLIRREGGRERGEIEFCVQLFPPSLPLSFPPYLSTNASPLSKRATRPAMTKSWGMYSTGSSFWS